MRQSNAREELSPKQRAFLAAYAKIGTVTHASAAAEVARQEHYRWMKGEGYQAAFTEAEQAYGDRLEAEADRRACDGVDEPVFYQGEECGVVRRYSDTLLALKLKAHRPEKYRERSDLNVTGRMAYVLDLGADTDEPPADPAEAPPDTTAG